MQTVYYQTSNFIRHTGNLVDLDEFRHKQALALESGSPQRDSLARQPEPACRTDRGEQVRVFRPVVLTATRAQRRRARRERRAWTLDACASLSVVFMTLAFVLRMLL